MLLESKGTFKHRKLTLQTSTAIGSTRRQSHRKTRETQQAYFISPGDMKGTVIAGLVLSLIKLQRFRERWKMKKGNGRQKHTSTHTHKHKHRHKTPGTFNWLKEAVGCWDALIADSMIVILTSTRTCIHSLMPSFIFNTTLGSLAMCLLQYKSHHIEAVSLWIDSFLFTSGYRCHVEEVVMRRSL